MNSAYPSFISLRDDPDVHIWTGTISQIMISVVDRLPPGSNFLIGLPSRKDRHCVKWSNVNGLGYV